MKRFLLALIAVLALSPFAARAEEVSSVPAGGLSTATTPALPAAAPGAPAVEIHTQRADPDGELAAIAAHQAGTPPPVIERADVTLVPYGYASATIRCAPLRVCAIELARGESVLHVATGDSER